MKEEKIQHFEKIQKTIWIPGMKTAEGMLGGKFCKSDSKNNQYLVSTFWDTEIHHNKYVENIVPDLKINSNSENNRINIYGKQISLVNSWKIF